MTPLQELINKLEQQGVHITDAAKHKYYRDWETNSNR